MTFLTFTSDSANSKGHQIGIAISDIEKICAYVDNNGDIDGSIIKTKAGGVEEYYAKESVEALVKQINS